MAPVAGVQPVEVEAAVEVVELMLQAARERAGCFQFDPLPGKIDTSNTELAQA